MIHNERAGTIFEDEVRQVAAAVWGLEPGDCQPAQYSADLKLREIDAIVRVNDVLHIVMATTRTDLTKCKEDCDRLDWAAKYFAKTDDLIKKWFVTRSQLQAPHHDYARKRGVTALTLNQFRRRAFDGAEYVALRSEAAFGSARDPLTNSPKLKDDAYVTLPLFLQKLRGSEIEAEPVDLNWIAEQIALGKIVILTAPFGGGKSLTAREIFKKLAAAAKNNDGFRWPLTLNLRDHYGQSAGDELLERHGRVIGFAKRTQLVAAWRSGMAHLLLDGFDEIGAQAIFQADNRHFMRTARRQALSGVRSLLSAVPAGSGVFLCGRNHFFDDREEMSVALGLESGAFQIVSLEEFDENSAREFLKKNKIQRELPDWVPRKPLILSYLLRKNLFDEILAIDGSRGVSYAWTTFLDRICEREAQLEDSVVEPRTLRHVLERLALLVRSRTSGDGPISGGDMADAYRIETGQDPAGSVVTQLQRLPGLAQRDNDPSARSFVDDDMLSALQGSGFARLILGAMGKPDAQRILPVMPVALTQLSRRAAEMASYLLEVEGARPELAINAAKRFCDDARRNPAVMQYAADSVSIALALARAAGTETLSFRKMTIEGAMVGKVSGEEVAPENLVFRDCNIEEVVIDNLGGVSFQNCTISKLSGAADTSAVPAGLIVDCDIAQFDDMSTNSAIQHLPLSPQMKALLVTLRKLYLQSGSGRQVSALYRGMPGAISKFVDPVLEVLESHHIVAISNGVAHPVRRQTARVHRILGAPSISKDDIVSDVLAL